MNYKFIKFDNVEEINQQFQMHFKDLLTIPNLFSRIISHSELASVAPKLLYQFRKHNLHLDVARVFVTPPGKKRPIHLDGNFENPKDLAINWPVVNCANTYMQWFDVKDNIKHIERSTTIYEGNKWFDEQECILIDQIELMTPAVVKINVPHTAVNYTDKNRIITSFRFFNDSKDLLNLVASTGNDPMSLDYQSSALPLS